MTLEFIDFAQAEFDETVAFYEERQPGLGDEFREEVIRVTRRILADPTSFSFFSRRTRICRTHRFPYGILFQVSGEHVRIVAVAHLHRDSGNWKDRIRE